MKLEALGDAPSFARLKCFVERAELVGVEVVQYQPDHLGIRVGLLHQIAGGRKSKKGANEHQR